MEKKNIKAGEDSYKEKTREQILDAAEILFSEKGFSNTSVRNITKKANCNLAAVNYHFRGKKNLYTEVFRRRMGLLTKQRITSLEKKLYEKDHHMALESLILVFVEIFIELFVKTASGSSFMKLMQHERHDPNLPKGLFLEEVVQPVRSIMREAFLVVCPELSRMEADLCLHSIVAQVINLMQAQDLFKGHNKEEMPLMDIEKSVEHIVKFSIGGVRQYLKENTR